MLHAIVAAMHDLIDGKRRNLGLRIRTSIGREFGGDLREPIVELCRGPRVQRRKRTDDARLALGDDQFRRRHDEHGRADHGQPQTALQTLGDGHVRNLTLTDLRHYGRTPLRRTPSRTHGTTMQFDTLLFDRRDNIAHITLNRPDRLNALNRALITDLTAAATAVSRRSRHSRRGAQRPPAAHSVRAPISWAMIFWARKSADPARPSGPDCASTSTPWSKPGISCGYPWWSRSTESLRARERVSPWLATSSWRRARPSFLQLFAPKLGLMPDLGSTFHLPRLVGTARAKGLALLGDALSAADAASWGTSSGPVVDDSALAEQAQSLARRLAAGPTQAFQRIKAVFNVEPTHTPRRATGDRGGGAGLNWATPGDFTEGVEAFRTKRAPVFRGK